MASANRGQFVWYEYLTRDVPAAITFYSGVAGWKTQPFEGNPAYTLWVGGQGPLGGVMQPPPGATDRPCWTAHVLVEDVDATAEAARRLGGAVHWPPTDIPDVGRFAVLGDPQGGVLAVFTPRPGPEMAPHDPAREGEFCWRELTVPDGAAALRFYSELLGWKRLDEMDMGPMGKYRVFGLGELRLGGVMDARPGAAPGWIYYLNTAGLDAAVARATARGARVVNGPVDIPGGGRIAQLVDPLGAPFALHQGP